MTITVSPGGVGGGGILGWNEATGMVTTGSLGTPLTDTMAVATGGVKCRDSTSDRTFLLGTSWSMLT